VCLGGTAAASNPLHGPAIRHNHHQFDYCGRLAGVRCLDNNQLVAVDHIEKHSEGCIIQQNLTFITDLYRREGWVPLAGIGVNRFDGERWLQLWRTINGVDSAARRPDEHGPGVHSIVPLRRDLKIIYEKHAEARFVISES